MENSTTKSRWKYPGMQRNIESRIKLFSTMEFYTWLINQEPVWSHPLHSDWSHQLDHQQLNSFPYKQTLDLHHSSKQHHRSVLLAQPETIIYNNCTESQAIFHLSKQIGFYKIQNVNYSICDKNNKHATPGQFENS